MISTVPVTNAAASEARYSDRLRDLVGRAEPAHGLAGAQRVQRLAGLLDQPPDPRRVDRPGQTALTRTPVPDVVDGQRPRERDDRALGRAVGGPVAQPDDAGDRGDVDDRSRRRGRSSPGWRACRYRNVPRALTAKTSSQTSSGVSGALVVEPMPATLTSTSTRVAIAGGPRPRRARRGRGVRPVVTERAGQGLNPLGRQVGERHAGALGVQRAGDGLADARAGPRHERRLAVEPRRLMPARPVRRSRLPLCWWR